MASSRNPLTGLPQIDWRIIMSTQVMPSFAFKPAKRIQTSFLAPLESQTLRWLAELTPRWINSDHLTLLGLAAMFFAGAGYWWSGRNRYALLAVIACLALNWLGDSLDGTLARARDQQRPRYGFYVDHVVDAFSTLFLMGGLALSGYMAERVAIGIMIVYLVISIEVYLATYTRGTFQISFMKFSPTELRILLAIGNIALFFHPMVHIFGQVYRLFDVGGIAGILGMTIILLRSTMANTAALYRAEALR